MKRWMNNICTQREAQKLCRSGGRTCKLRIRVVEKAAGEHPELRCRAALAGLPSRGRETLGEAVGGRVGAKRTMRISPRFPVRTCFSRPGGQTFRGLGTVEGYLSADPIRGASAPGSLQILWILMHMLWAPERTQSQAVQAVLGREIDDWPTLPSCSKSAGRYGPRQGPAQGRDAAGRLTTYDPI